MSSISRKYETERTRRLRTTPLSEQDEQTISHVEEFGCSIVNVARTHWGLGWSYTIGVFDTCGKPELVTVGLLPETAQFALNAAANLLRAGVDLAKGRHHDLIGEVDCEFRPVDPNWVRQLMDLAKWYYANEDFPVLQVVYPDLNNRFPEDEGFDETFAQPLMQFPQSISRTDEDFWASTDPQSSLFDWKFPDSPHTGVFLSETVHRGTEPVTYVSHDSDDGAWQFLGDSMSDGGGPVLSCFHHPIDRDPSLAELADLPMGWYAQRSGVRQPWTRHEKPLTNDEG